MNKVIEHSHLIYPTVGTIAYLSWPKTWRLSPTILHPLSVIHNSALILFSAYTFYSISSILWTEGIVFQKNYYFGNPKTNFDQVIYLFYLSKYWEYFDTFMIYLKGKKPMFLQTYHHIGAAIFWHLCYYNKVDAVWIPSLFNSFVHTVMYSYYLSTLLRWNGLRKLKPYITTMQLVQFFVGNSLCLYFYKPPVETQLNYNIICGFVAYACGLIILFGQFFLNSYYKKPTINSAVNKLE
jgi:hypothetical protein